MGSKYLLLLKRYFILISSENLPVSEGVSRTSKTLDLEKL